MWPAGLLVIVFGAAARRTKAILAAVWSLAGAVVWLAYFIGYEATGRSSSVAYALANPAAGAEYLAALLGASMFDGRGLALVAGISLAVFAAVGTLLAARDARLGEESFWISVFAFCSGSPCSPFR